MNELEQLKAKYQELGAVIERMEKGEAEFKPLQEGWIAYGDGDHGQNQTVHPYAKWNIMATEKDAERLAMIFQAVAEQEHLVKFVNGDWRPNDNDAYCIYALKTGQLSFSNGIRPDVGSPRFKDDTAVERALKLASPNLLAYWKREL